MQFDDEEDFIHHEVESDDSIQEVRGEDISVNNKEKHQQTPLQKVLANAPLNTQKQTPTPQTGKKSFRDLFQKKVVEQLKKITDHNSSDDYQQQDDNNVPDISAPKKAHNQQPYQSQCQVLMPRQEKPVEQQNIWRPSKPNIQSQPHIGDEQKRQRYMKIMANHYVQSPNFQQAIMQSQKDINFQPNIRVARQKPLDPTPGELKSTGYDGANPCVINSVVKKRESRILQQELKKYEEYKKGNLQSDEPQQNKSRAIQYITAVPEGYSQKGEKKRYSKEIFHICNDQGQEDEDGGVEKFLANEQMNQRDLVGFGDDGLGDLNLFKNQLENYQKAQYQQKLERALYDPQKDNRWEQDFDQYEQMELLEQKELEAEMNRNLPKSALVRQSRQQFRTFRNMIDQSNPFNKKYWIPLRKLEDIPNEFYMFKKFDQQVGLAQADSTSIKTPYDAFKLFFNKEVYNHIINRTNSKIQQDHVIDLQAYVDGVNPTRPLAPNFTLNEFHLDAFFAAQIYMGFLCVRRQQDHFEKAERLKQMAQSAYSQPPQYGYQQKKEFSQDLYEDDENFIVGKMTHIMDKSLYDQIKNNLHISDNSVKGSDDPQAKIRDFIELVNRNFQKHFNPGEFLVFDETIIPLTIKQDYHQKLNKMEKSEIKYQQTQTQGIKEYIICDAIRGFTIDISLQQIDNQNAKQELDDEVTLLTQEKIYSMLQKFAYKNHKVVMNRNYTNPDLFSKLKKLEIGAVGTVKHDKTNLSLADLDDAHFQSIYPPEKDFVSYISIDKDNILLYFQGTNQRECAILSSFIDISKNYQHQASVSKNHYRMTPFQTQPYMIYLYNKYIGGSDKRNSFVSQWRTRIKNQKWWRAILDRYFQTAVTNAAILLRQLHPDKTTKVGWLKDFRRSLMHEMTQRYREYQLREDPKKREKLAKSSQLYKTHTLVEGQIQLNCIECGNEIQSMCQECSMLLDCLIGVCKEGSDDCYKYHVCNASGWDSVKASEITQPAQEQLQKKRRHRGRPSTWATIKQLREYKMQLEMENEKITQGTSEYDRAIGLLNETLSKLTKSDPNIEISNELSELLQQFSGILPQDYNIKVKKQEQKTNKLEQSRKQEVPQDGRLSIIDLRQQEDVNERTQKKIKKQEGDEIIELVVDLSDLQTEKQAGERKQDQQTKEQQDQEKQLPLIYNMEQKAQLEQLKQQQKKQQQEQQEQGPVKKIKLMGKNIHMVNF